MEEELAGEIANRCDLHARFVEYEDESIAYVDKLGDMVMQREDEPLEYAIQRMIKEREAYRDNAIKAEAELAALKADDNLTVAYMSGFHDGKKAALKAGHGEPVARIVDIESAANVWWYKTPKELGIGTLLYTAAPKPEE